MPQTPSANARRVAVIGAGIAGLACARALAEAGLAVQVFDKSRGVGGRLSTRRTPWADAQGQARQTAFDHGAPAFGAGHFPFVHWLEAGEAQGWMTRWQPRLAPGSQALAGPLWLAAPDMPELCRRLLGRLPLHTGHTVQALQRDAAGLWRLQMAEGGVAGPFDRVVLAMPPAQAAALLAPHAPAWAGRARAVPMRADWTLMGVTAALPLDWDMDLPPTGPLGQILRNQRKPGRDAASGLEHWVLHARRDWSEAHLEDEPAAVQAALQAALAERLGRPLDWQLCTVHRWRYAQPAQPAFGSLAWWDAALGLAVCGDFLGSDEGVESAWRSGQVAAQRLLHGLGDPAAEARHAEPALSA